MGKRRTLIAIGVDGGTPTVLEQYARDGSLPNIAEMLERGTFAEVCLPPIPTITPTCWATITPDGVTTSVNCDFAELLARGGVPR